MTYRLVTLEQVKQQLGYDDSLSDARINFRIEAVSRAIMDYIGDSAALAGWTLSDGTPLVDDDGNPQVKYLLVDSNGDAVLDSNGDRQFYVADAIVGSDGEYVGGESIIPGQVQSAAICALSEWDENRSANFITPAVVSLLARTRDLAFA